VYQLNVASKEIKDLSPKQLFADPFQTKMAEKGAEKSNWNTASWFLVHCKTQVH
jgi:hypothetical protein